MTRSAVERNISWNDPLYAELLARDPGAMLYHSPFWLGLLEETLGAPVRLLGLLEQGRLGAAIPYAVAEGPLGPVLNSLPFFGTIGGIISAEGGPGRLEQFRTLARALFGVAEDMGAFSTCLITRPGDPMETSYRRAFRPDFEDFRTAYFLDLPEPSKEEPVDQQMLRTMAPHKRRALRKARGRSFRVRAASRPEELAAFCEMHRRDLTRRGGLAKPASFLEAVSRRLDSKGVELWVAQDGPAVAAGILFFLHEGTAEYYMTGLSPEYRDQHPQTAIIYEAARSFSERGMRVLNFGGTWPTQNGLARFKSEWGAAPKPYRYLIRVFRDRLSLRSLTPGWLTERYPFFYVLPFSELEAA